jgi:hypothetical protein
MKELGDVAWFLGCRIIRDRKARLIWIFQDSYVSTIAERFGIEISNKKRLTPMKSGIELTKAPAGFNCRIAITNTTITSTITASAVTRTVDSTLYNTL